MLSAWLLVSSALLGLHQACHLIFESIIVNSFILHTKYRLKRISYISILSAQKEGYQLTNYVFFLFLRPWPPYQNLSRIISVLYTNTNLTRIYSQTRKHYTYNICSIWRSKQITWQLLSRLTLIFFTAVCR